MRVEVETVTSLRFDDGSPVRAASAVVPFRGGWLVAQDDATYAAWVHGGSVSRVPVLPAVDGLETFEESAGTKHLKPDLEAAFAVADGSVVLLGSGSSPARLRGCHVRAGSPPQVAGLAGLYTSAAAALGVGAPDLNLEGACVVGDVVRWFHRGLPAAGVPTASVDVDVAGLLAAIDGDVPAGSVRVRDVRTYDLGTVADVGLAVTDAVALPDGTVLVSTAAEDTPDPREDGPVVGAGLAVLDGTTVVDACALPAVRGGTAKVEGLAVVAGDAPTRLLATVDADDPAAPSLAVRLVLHR